MISATVSFSPLPMMYMPDAIRATLQLMEAPAASVRERGSYNLAGISFTPLEIAADLPNVMAAIKRYAETVDVSRA